jgi:hypothetical protein
MNLRQRRERRGVLDLNFELGGGHTPARSDFDSGEVRVCEFCENRDEPMQEFIWREFRGVEAKKSTETESDFAGLCEYGPNSCSCQTRGQRMKKTGGPQSA